MAQPIYRSTDASAPVIDNNAGSLCATLDAVLVNGYGSKAPLGWTIKFTAANKRVYKMGGGTGFELRIDETGNVYEGLARGAESFSDVNTIGTGGFPTVAQAASGNFWQKTVNSAGARPWIIIGDNKRFCYIVECNIGANWSGGFFGDIVSYKPGGDPYCCMIFGGRPATSSSAATADFLGQLVGHSNQAAVATHYIARAHTGLGSSIANMKYTDTGRNQGATVSGSQGMTFPDNISGGLHLGRMWVGEPSPTIATRGYIPGLWVPCHDRAAMAAGGVANGDTFSGSDGLVSRTFEFRFGTFSGSAGAIAFETSNWPESA